MKRDLGVLLDGEGVRLFAEVGELVERKVSDGPFDPLEKELTAKSGNLSVLGRAVPVEASLDGRLQIHKPDFKAPAFPGDPLTAVIVPPANKHYAELTLGGLAGLTGKALAPSVEGLKLNLGVELKAEAGYSRFLPVPADATRLEAFRSVVAGSRIPNKLDLKKLAEGEVQRFEAQLALDLGLRVPIAGGAAGFVGDLFRELPSPISVHAEYTVQAAIGAALYERFEIVAGRPPGLPKGWVRLRISRASRRRLSVGASFALQVKYDLSAGPLSVLDEVLEYQPLARALSTLREVAEKAENVSAANWPDVRAKLVEKAGERVTALLGSEDWFNDAFDSPAVRRLISWSREVVGAFDQVEPELLGLWERVLGKIGLEDGAPVRKLLNTLSELDSDKPEALLDEELRPFLAVVELLGGVSLEDLLLSKIQAREALRKVKGLADHAIGFLEDPGLQDFLKRLRDFEKETNLLTTVEWLRDNATSAEKLREKATGFVGDLVRKVLNKKLEDIKQADVDKVKAWARRLAEALRKPEELEGKIRKAFERLQGEVGLSVAVELERLTKSAALLDLELDPRDAANSGVLRAWDRGSISEILGALPQSDPDDEDELAVPYNIRECVFTSRRARTSSFALFFSFLGWQKASRRQLTESEVRVSGQGGVLRRDVTERGEAMITGEWQGTTARAAVAVESTASGPGGNLGAAYTPNTFKTALSLTFSREDPTTHPDDLKAWHVLLQNLGFTGLAVPGPSMPAGVSSRFAIKIRLPMRDQLHPVQSFFQGFDGGNAATKQWAADYLNALFQTFRDPQFAADPAPEGQAGLSRGHVMASALIALEQDWIKGRQELENRATSSVIQIQSGGVSRDIQLAKREGSAVIWKTYTALPISRSRFGKSLRPMREVREALAKAPTPQSLRDLSRAAARAFAATSVSAAHWPNPLLIVWAVVARLSRVDPAGLRGAEGMAILRWKNAAGEWDPENLRTWSFEPEKLVHPAGQGFFIFKP